MLSRLLAGVALVASFARAGDVSVVALSGGENGTRIRFTLGEEHLSRVVPTTSGLRIDVLGSTSSLKGIHRLDGNPLFQEVRCTPVQTAQERMVRFEFLARPGATIPKVQFREWNGRDIDFVLDRKPVATPFLATWVAQAPVQVPVLASLETSANLTSARASAQGDLETVHLHFTEAPPKASLSGSGTKYEISLGKAKVSAKLGGLGSGLLVKSMASSKKAGETILSLVLAEPARSMVLSRAGNVVQVRMVRASSVEGVLVWDSKTGKTEQLVRSDLPADEVASIGSVAKGKPTGGAVFSPEGSQAAFNAQTDAVNVGVGASGNVAEAERLEAERRKSREFALEQERKAGADQALVDAKNRVVYNTFGIRDPFIPLQPDDIEGGLNIDQMKVVGIIYSATRPMAVLEHVNQSGLSVALREGDAIQNGRVLRILRDQVVFVLEEFGVTRQFTLKLQVPKGEKS